MIKFLDQCRLVANAIKEGHTPYEIAKALNVTKTEVLNMADNVAEWCADLYLPTGPATSDRAGLFQHAVRGDSFANRYLECGINCSKVCNPRLCAEDVGIRVVTRMDSPH